MLLTDLLPNNGFLKLFKIWLVGYIIGVILAVSIFRLQEYNKKMSTKRKIFFIKEPKSHYLHENVNLDDLSEESVYYWKKDHWFPPTDSQLYMFLWPQALLTLKPVVHTHKGEDTSVAKYIAKKVRVFCIIMTDQYRHPRAHIIKNTWGNKCDKLLFMSSSADKSLPAVALSAEGDDLWSSDMEAFRYVYFNYRDEAEWFIKTDDETYVIMENLKYMLNNYSSSEAVYFSCMPQDNPKQILPFQTGYVFSKAALKIFSTRAQDCNVTNSENVLIEKCLRYLNITMLDSRDSVGRTRFFPYSPPFLGLSSGAADYAISFYNVTDNFVYLFEYFIYHLRPFGIVANYAAPDVDK